MALMSAPGLHQLSQSDQTEPSKSELQCSTHSSSAFACPGREVCGTRRKTTAKRPAQRHTKATAAQTPLTANNAKGAQAPRAGPDRALDHGVVAVLDVLDHAHEVRHLLLDDLAPPPLRLGLSG